ncbi:MAG: polysaccharide biosynthesis protein [Acidobacteriota bacterium]|nr:polysaccharide biosynthesis protein [Acidobacteriota bacterium]MDQ5835652.1 polysaccharide biosynthesis protein [Acidobacteriota bacterium]
MLKGRFRVVLVGRNNERNQQAREATGCESLPMDVSNIESVRDIFTEVRPDVVVHAAATKYVDLSERQPMECIDVNVHGSQNIARVSVERGVRLVVGMSTDKAAPPVGNTYGLTKALMERVFCAMNGKAATHFLCVRHGNIAWSTGSVFPAWKRMQETNGGVIGSTGPDMTRYFSTVSEAAELVATAIDNAERFQGKVLLRDMKAALIRDILELWVRQKGGSWHQIEGRPGERPHEYLVGEPELPYATETEIEGVRHFVISFNEPVARRLPRPLCSADAPRLSDEEILDIINNPPPEEFS